MKVTELYPEGVQHVVHNMRAKDRTEIFATQWTDDPWELGNTILRMEGVGFILHADDGEPVLCCGAMPMWNGVMSIWMFSTDRFDDVSIPGHRFAKRVFFPCLDEIGWHRLECRSIATHHVAHRWLEMLGARKECEVSNYGKAGETFFQYCWTKPPADTQSNQTNVSCKDSSSS